MKKIFIFLAGVGVGAGVTFIYCKKNYEESIQQEVKDLREYYMGKEKKPEVKDAVDVEVQSINDNNSTEEQETIDEKYDTVVENLHYSKKEDSIDNSNTLDRDGLSSSLLSEEEFGAESDYDAISLYYHSNDVITDDNDDQIITDEELNNLFGMNTIQIGEQFGTNESNAVYFRNYKLKCDYEILYDESEFPKEE